MRLTRAVLITLLLWVGVAWSQESVTIGVVKDGPSPASTGVIAAIKVELQGMAGQNRTIVFKESPDFDAGWDPTRVQGVVGAALNDPDVDYILLDGALVSREAEQRSLNKPVVSTFVHGIDVFHLADMDGDRSTKPYYSFMLDPERYENDLRAYRDLIPFENAVVLIGLEYIENIPSIVEDAKAIGDRLGVQLRVIPVSTEIEPALAQIDINDHAVLLSTIPRIDEATRQQLIAWLTERRIPTFSLVSHRDVELGALASQTPDYTQQISRRAAINLRELMDGVPTEQLPVLLSLDNQLLINGETAAAVGYSPTLEVETFAEFVNKQALRSAAAPLDMKETLRLAEAGNVSLSIATQSVVSAQKQKNIARSPLLPDIRFTPAYQSINAGANGLDQLIPDQQITLGIKVRQMIYDDRRISDFRSQSRLAEGSEALRETELMDVFEQAGRSYLVYVLTRILYGVGTENLRLTEHNLELAQVRLDVGHSGRDEVYRWESEEARRQTNLLRTQAEVEAQRIALNQTLGLAQNRRWDPAQIDVDPDIFPFLEGRLSFIFQDGATYQAFTETAVQFALLNAPELLAINKGKEAQNITLNQRTRRWFLPNFQLAFDYDYRVAQDPDIVGLSESIPRFFITADYPIFEGTRRANEVGLARSELNRIGYEELLARQLVERRARTAIERMQNSFPTIRFSKRASETGRKNLLLVQDKYAQGLASVTHLLDAQNQSFQAEQSEAATTYSFLIDLLDFQRSIAWFEDTKSDQQIEEFVEMIDLGMNPE